MLIPQVQFCRALNRTAMRRNERRRKEPAPDVRAGAWLRPSTGVRYSQDRPRQPSRAESLPTLHANGTLKRSDRERRRTGALAKMRISWEAHS